MSLRITHADQLALCSPHVRKQLEGLLPCPETAVLTSEASPEAEKINTPAKRRGQPEQEAGRMLVRWLQTVRLPNGLRPFDFFTHVPNEGVFAGRIRGGILQGQGVKSGWPDYVLDLPLGRYHGFRLELKAEHGATPDAEQLDILARLEAVGFKVAVAWGFDDAKRAFERYLGLAR